LVKNMKDKTLHDAIIKWNEFNWNFKD
jgi:hypothetical protein